MRVLGIILAILGIGMLVINGFNFTTEKEIVDVGPVEINKQEEHSIGWPMYAGGIVAAAGVILIVAGGKKK